MDVMIRPCRADECALVLEMWKAAGSMTSITDNVDILKCIIDMPSSTVLVAEAQGKLVGTAIAGFDGWRGNLYRLAVLPAYRRQGIARLLVKEAEKFLASKGAQRMGGLVGKDEGLAVSFWDALSDTSYVRDESFVRYTKSV